MIHIKYRFGLGLKICGVHIKTIAKIGLQVSYVKKHSPAFFVPTIRIYEDAMCFLRM